MKSLKPIALRQINAVAKANVYKKPFLIFSFLTSVVIHINAIREKAAASVEKENTGEQSSKTTNVNPHKKTVTAEERISFVTTKLLVKKSIMNIEKTYFFSLIIFIASP